jgi:hypothetical protein
MVTYIWYSMLLVLVCACYALGAELSTVTEVQFIPEQHINQHINRTPDHVNNNVSPHRNNHKHSMKHGAVDLVPTVSVHGAIIVSDRGISTAQPASEEEHKQQQLAKARTESVNNLVSELPFELTEWAAVFTLACPLYPNGHRTERGLLWAHYRILREFAYFDPLLLHQVGYIDGQQPRINTTLTSRDGAYAVHPNGTLYKNGLPFLDIDIIAIFEDDAESAIKDLNVTILEEFRAMSTDLLFLGWCEGRTARPVPLCTHAYALTRRGAKKLVKFIEPCGMALDEQFVIMAKNNFISWRRAYGHSYKELNDKYRGRYGEKTYGIFHQNKALGSINGHRRRL